jgi:energy-converting hydrogenase Eha subunit A
MRCPKCGFMQGRNPQCKRCGTPLAATPARATTRTRAVAARPAAPPPLEPPPLEPAGLEPPLIDNPYAPPTAGGYYDAPPEGELYRDGKILIARDGAIFPDHCVRCNRPAQGFRLKRTFYWHPQAWYLLILVSILIYAIVAIVVRKKATFEVPICPEHRSRRRLFIGLAFLAPLVLCVGGGVLAEDLLGLWIALAVLVAIVFGILASQLLTPNRIDDEWAYLKGAHQDFLAQLPMAM